MCRKAERVMEILQNKECEIKLLDEWAQIINGELAPQKRMSKKTLGTVFYILNESGQCIAERSIQGGNIFYDVRME